MDVSELLLNKKYWVLHILFVIGVSVWGCWVMGKATYDESPPICDYLSPKGEVVMTADGIYDGQEIFLTRGFMTYGSFWGDGAERGPDFTSDALHQMTVSMEKYYTSQFSGKPTMTEKDSVGTRIIRELHTNGAEAKDPFDTDCVIRISEGQTDAFSALKVHYNKMFKDPSYPEYVRGISIEKDEIDKMSSFFYWGAWASAANRPGEDYSYTHNWPHDPVAGNIPTAPVLMWSVLSVGVLFVGILVVLYAYGQIRAREGEPFNKAFKMKRHWLTTPDLEDEVIRSTQREAFNFFALAMICFGLQVLSGIICASDFIRPFGIFLGDVIPFSVSRAYHTIFQIFWFFMCWVGYTIFFLPRLSKVPYGQKFLVNLLFVCSCLIALGTLFGIYLSHTGMIKGEWAYWFGSQGWEFMELGRFFQLFLLVGFVLWILIIFRGVYPWLTSKNMLSTPAWLLYGSGIMVFFLFFGLFVKPRSNFAVANFWRWMVVHMWVEVTFEVFTTVIVGYMMVQMGFINKRMAENTIFLAVMMFLFTATCGVAHNFYWIAKPTIVIALGSAFSTTQVLPLLLLTLDASKLHKETRNAQKMLQKLESGGKTHTGQKNIMSEVWLYLVAVNFWNVFGAGVMGSVINLPIVNYYEHATYLTNNHAHGAMFGVKGNIALGGMLYCCQHLYPRHKWNRTLVRTSFWSLQIGIALMMFMDLFPVGLYQVNACMEKGFWYARSHEILKGDVFFYLTYFRMVGGNIFVFGGLLPLIYFVLSRFHSLLPETKIKDVPFEVYEREFAMQKTKEE